MEVCPPWPGNDKQQKNLRWVKKNIYANLVILAVPWVYYILSLILKIKLSRLEIRLYIVFSLADDYLTVLWQLKPQKLTLVFQKFLLSNVLFGLNLYNKFQYPTGNFPVQYQIFPKFQIREFPFHFRDWDGTGNGQSRMAWLRQAWVEDVPKCSGREIFRIFLGKSGSREMAFGNADLYIFITGLI